MTYWTTLAIIKGYLQRLNNINFIIFNYILIFLVLVKKL
nr:MAG TPA: hypothetical protein [Caudoviricetes sp.]